MKTVLIICLSACSWFASFPSAVADELVSQISQAALPGSVHEEVERLRQEFDRRRAKALRPVVGRYVAQLEELQRSVADQDRAAEAEIAAALKAAKEAFSQVDQPDLRRVLLERNWIWRSNFDRNGVVVVFHADGTVEHLGLHGNWQVTAPNEIKISTDGDGDYILHFNASLRAFEGNRDQISGTALPSAVETLCANIWSLRGDKLQFRRDGRLFQLGEGWEGRDWRLSDDGTQVTIRFTNGNGGTFKFENGTMTHFDGTPFQSAPKE